MEINLETLGKFVRQYAQGPVTIVDSTGSTRKLQDGQPDVWELALKADQFCYAGGYPGGGPGTPAYSLAESFKVSKNAWTTLASMPQSAMASGSAVYKGRLYCFGGWATFQGSPINNVQIYQP